MTTTSLVGGALSVDAPWPGLRAFSASESAFFFGRDREIAELRALIVRAPVVLLYGQSGLGKTSLLQAGLFHELRTLNLLPFRVRLDHRDNAPSLADQLKAALTEELDAAGVNAPRPDATESLWEYFHRTDVDFWGPRNRLVTPVMVFDQFEEMFTLGQRSDAAVARGAQFVDELEALLEHRPPEHVRAALDRNPEDALRYEFQRQSVKLVITLREDFLAHLDTWRTRMPSLLPHRYRLERLTGAQALEVVERGGKQLVTPDVARGIVEFVSGGHRKRRSVDPANRQVEPALLSVVCDELNRRRIERGQTRITADLLSGESAGIIQAFYERAFEGIDPKVREWIEDDLLTASGYRDRGALEDAVRLGLREPEFDRLVDRRVLHREERDGIVWLELTHDLLSDPAAQSRAQREHRQQAEEAAKRGAESAQQLRKARKLAAVFAALLIVSVALGALALFMKFEADAASRTAKAAADGEKIAADRAKASAAAERRSAEDAERSARKAEAEATRARESFTTATETADRLGSRLMNFVRRDMRVPTATVLEIIRSAEESYAALAAHGESADDVTQRRARFLTTAAQARYQVGHITSGLAHAREAIDLLESAVPTGQVPTVRSLRAEALYARGYGQAATGQLVQADRDFSQVLALVTSGMAHTRALELARVYCLAHIGLGEIQLSRLVYPAAQAHFSRVLDFLDRNGRSWPPQETGLWRVNALRGMALAQYRMADIDRWLRKADSALRGLIETDGADLRWVRLSAEVASRLGNSAINRQETAQGIQFFARATREATRLVQHDPDNLDWRLQRIRSVRAKASGDTSRSLWGDAKTLLDEAQDLAATVLKAEPEWTAARYLRGALLYDLALVHRHKSPADPDRAMKLFQEAGAEFTAILRRAPADSEAVRGLALATGGEGLIHADQKRHDRALKSFDGALQTLAPLTRIVGVDGRVLANRAFFLRSSAASWEEQKRPDKAQTALLDAVVSLKELTAVNPQSADYIDLSETLMNLGEIHRKGREYAAAEREYARAEEAAAQARRLQPQSLTVLRRLAQIHHSRAELLLGQGDMEAAFEQVERGSTVAWDGLRQEPWNTALQQTLDELRSLAARFDVKIVNIAGLPPYPASSAAIAARAKRLLAIHDISLLTDWFTPPQMRGAWRNLRGEDLAEAREALSAVRKDIRQDQIVAVRRLPLDVYEGGELFEAGVLLTAADQSNEDDGPKTRLYGIVPFVRRKVPEKPPTPSIVVLNGTSPPIHEMNGATPPQLDTPGRAAQYLRFFNSSVYGEEGAFAVVERADDVRLTPGADPKLRATIAEAIQPLQITRQDPVMGDAKRQRKGWNVTGTVLYGNALFNADLFVYSTGLVEMENDVEVARNLPVMQDYFEAGIRLTADRVAALSRRTDAALKRDPQDVEALRTRVRLSAQRKAWKDAVADQRTRMDALRRTKKTNADFISEFVNLSWYQLFARDYAGALATTDEGRTLNAAYLPLDTNRAHALLFLGRVSDAEKLYFGHMGKQMPNEKQSWDEVILEDFDRLSAEGITHPAMARIRERLKSGSGKPR